MADPLPKLAAAQIITRCRLLATHTETPGETTRTFLSPPMHEVHALLTDWANQAGMQVHIDPIGNLHALFGHPESPRLLIASHLDTVPNAGPFDGILGVLLGLALVESLPAPLENLAIELIGFSEEEGIRFRRPFLGSLALTGQLTDLTLEDPTGITLAQAIRDFGLDPTAVPAMRLPKQAIAYLEVHIEQGPVLESRDRPLAVVPALVGQTRMEFIFKGQANHAGTTPMHLRQDALAAAATWVVQVESLAQATEGLVATVGRLEVSPGAGNVIPGQVLALLDVRHADDQTRAESVAHLIAAAVTAATARAVHLSHRLLLEQLAVALDQTLTALLAESSTASGHPPEHIPSGAGHDAMILAPHLPSAMLFIRSPRGLSHHPGESVLPEDVAAALATGLHFVQALAARANTEAKTDHF